MKMNSDILQDPHKLQGILSVFVGLFLGMALFGAAFLFFSFYDLGFLIAGILSGLYFCVFVFFALIAHVAILLLENLRPKE